MISNILKGLFNNSKPQEKKQQKNKIALIRKGEVDLNKQQGEYYDNLLLVENDLFIPKSLLEYGVIVRGEAGSGKTIILDRFIVESVNAGHSVILHNVKGDELKKISSFTSFYLIEPWSKYSFEIDFLNLCADNIIQAENTKIRTLVEAFSKPSNEFFDKAAITITEALIRSVIRTNKDKKGIVKGRLKDIVSKWHSFNIDESITQVNQNNLVAIATAMKAQNKQLIEINKFLKEYYPTATSYIDPGNEKTSLCVLCSAIDTIRKFETLSEFWELNAISKEDKNKRNIFDIKKWINAEKDRKVVILSNSNTYNDVANSFISAFINLVTNEVIDSNYEPKKEIHFILDEFVQLTAINLNTFLKLPDVGRGKKIRVKIAYQRSDQIKSAFPNQDEKSFASAFQIKLWCRFADSDKDFLKHELGKQELTSYKDSSSWSQTQSISNQTEIKLGDICNIDELQKELKPIRMLDKNGELQTYGASVLCNFPNVRAIAILKMPFVVFPKRKAYLKFNSKAGAGGNNNNNTDNKKDDKEEIAQEIKQILNQSVEVVQNQLNQATSNEIDKIDDLGVSIVKEAVAEVLDHSGVISTALIVGDLIDDLSSSSNNNNVVSVKDEIDENDLDNLLNAMSKTNKNNKENTR